MTKISKKKLTKLASLKLKSLGYKTEELSENTVKRIYYMNEDEIWNNSEKTLVGEKNNKIAIVEIQTGKLANKLQKYIKGADEVILVFPISNSKNIKILGKFLKKSFYL